MTIPPKTRNGRVSKNILKIIEIKKKKKKKNGLCSLLSFFIFGPFKFIVLIIE